MQVVISADLQVNFLPKRRGVIWLSCLLPCTPLLIVAGHPVTQSSHSMLPLMDDVLKMLWMDLLGQSQKCSCQLNTFKAVKIISTQLHFVGQSNPEPQPIF